MMKTSKYNIKVFDIDKTPSDFNPNKLINLRMQEEAIDHLFEHTSGRRQYAIIITVNTIGDSFFYSGRHNDCVWDLIAKGFLCFKDYYELPAPIRDNSVLFYYETQGLDRERPCYYGSPCATPDEIDRCNMGYDFIFVKPFINKYEGDDDILSEMIGDICYDGSWGARYFLRVKCHPEAWRRLSDSDLDSLANHAEMIMFEGIM